MLTKTPALPPLLLPLFQRTLIMTLPDGQLVEATLVLVPSCCWPRLRASREVGWTAFRIGGYTLGFRLLV